MGTQRAHGGHAKGKPNALNINDLQNIKFLNGHTNIEKWQDF